MNRARISSRHAYPSADGSAPLAADAAARGPSKRADLTSFRSLVWKYWKENGRHDLPWRKTKDAYKILVSEVMLQQTQVPRVIEKYSQFVKRFPTVRSLANAEFRDVLKMWSGLGYNRRGKYLYEAARKIVDENGSRVPKSPVALQKLPGIGPYTADAIRVFAFNEHAALLETNVRAAYIYHFFPDAASVADKELMPLIQEAAVDQDPREWNWALMDYGSHIKKLHKNPSRRSKHYVRQSKFEGSLRQKRGEILRKLISGSMMDLVGPSYRKAIESLIKDELIIQEKGKWRIV